MRNRPAVANGVGPVWAATAGLFELVQAICDYVHDHISFGYHHARLDQERLLDAFGERTGVCRDFAHLAVTRFAAALNIPARYCTGYRHLGDTGVPACSRATGMDFAAWIEVYRFRPAHNQRKSAVLIARGRDAADVAISNTFGPATLVSFKVITDEIAESVAA